MAGCSRRLSSFAGLDLDLSKRFGLPDRLLVFVPLPSPISLPPYYDGLCYSNDYLLLASLEELSDYGYLLSDYSLVTDVTDLCAQWPSNGKLIADSAQENCCLTTHMDAFLSLPLNNSYSGWISLCTHLVYMVVCPLFLSGHPFFFSLAFGLHIWERKFQ